MNEEEIFVTEKPRIDFLRKYIAYYYFHRKDTGPSKKFIYYPHTRCGLTIYKQSDVIFENYSSTTIPDKDIPYKFLYGSVEKKAWHVEMKTPFNKIGIAFQPLGINSFIRQDLHTLLANRESKDFDIFSPDIDPILDQVYDTDSIDEKVQLLDNFLLENYVEFKEERLCNAVKLLLNSSKKYSVQELSEYLSVSRKTLYRLFKIHLDCSVKDYINVVQFRKAVEEYQEAMKKPQFVNLAHEADYYDQSEFIRHFKKITGFNPKRFFKDLRHLGNEDTFWTFS